MRRLRQQRGLDLALIRHVVDGKDGAYERPRCIEHGAAPGAPEADLIGRHLDGEAEVFNSFAAERTRDGRLLHIERRHSVVGEGGDLRQPHVERRHGRDGELVLVQQLVVDEDFALRIADDDGGLQVLEELIEEVPLAEQIGLERRALDHRPEPPHHRDTDHAGGPPDIHVEPPPVAPARREAPVDAGHAVEPLHIVQRGQEALPLVRMHQ